MQAIGHHEFHGRTPGGLVHLLALGCGYCQWLLRQNVDTCFCSLHGAGGVLGIRQRYIDCIDRAASKELVELAIPAQVLYSIASAKDAQLFLVVRDQRRELAISPCICERRSTATCDM